MHFIGKKVVEEAAESWMAAEHEGPERAAEEISQLLYQAQVLMLATGLELEGRLPTSVTCPRPVDRPSDPKEHSVMLRIAVPNKGTLAAPAAQMLREAGLPPAHRRPRTWSAATRPTTSSSSTCARGTSPPTSAPATSTSASPAGTC